MSKKLTVLAHSLGSFTIADLAAKAGVLASTAQTVLSRSRQEWFAKSQLQTGARGGQPKSYELNDAGRLGIEQMLGSVGVLPRLAPEQPAADVPLGLVSAQETLKQLTTATAAAVAGLREDALGNLQRAEAEVREGAYPAHASQLLAQISRLRHELGKDARQGQTEQEVSRRTAARTADGEALAAIARRRRAHRRDTAWYVVGPSPSPRPTHVFISYVGNDESTRELAAFARGALVVAQSERGAKFDLVVQRLAMETLADELTGKWPRLTAGVTEVVLCINSEVNTQAIRNALEQLEASATSFRGAVVLDQSFSHLVQTFARDHHICYEPHASEANPLEWIEYTLSGRAAQPAG